MKVITRTLPNGVRGYVLPMPAATTVTVLVMVSTGSDYESSAESGLSHFLEHMCFKGTSKRPTSRDISTELDALGAVNNAFTSHEYTGYYAKGASRHFRTIFDVVSDLYLDPTFPASELEKEKGVIIEEMNMYEDLPQRKVGNVFRSLYFGDQPAGRTILGDPEVIRTATRDSFVKFRAKHYQPQATHIFVSGDVEPAEAFSMIKAAFGKIAPGRKARKAKVTLPKGGERIALLEKPTDQAHLIMGVPAFHAAHPKAAVLEVLHAVLGEGMSSRLFQVIREELGVAYYVRSFIDAGSDYGILGAAAGVDKVRVPEVVRAIAGEWRKLAAENVGTAELSKAKESLLGGTAMSIESTDSAGEFIAHQQLIKGSFETFKEYERGIRSVRPEDVRALARTLFKPGVIRFAAVGSVTDEAAVRAALSA